MFEGTHKGLDYTKTFLSVVKHITIRWILIISVKINWNLYQLDVNNVFLYGELDKRHICDFHLAWWLLHLLLFFDFKNLLWAQTCPRQWYACLSSAFGTRGFTFSLNDYFLFFKSIDCLITIIAVYVDNILITRKNAFEISEINIFLHNILRKRIWVWLIIS